MIPPRDEFLEPFFLLSFSPSPASTHAAHEKVKKFSLRQERNENFSPLPLPLFASMTKQLVTHTQRR
jgi:hypothetical protein